jgi:hypothetical protein
MVYKLLEAAGPVCTRFHDETVRGVASKRIQCDEAWAFCYAKQKNVASAKAAPEDAGDVWTWTAGRRTDPRPTNSGCLVCVALITHGYLLTF